MIHPNRKSKDRSLTPVQLGQGLEHRLRSYVTSAKALAANWEKAAVAVSTLSVVLASTPLEAEVVYTPTNDVLHRDIAGVSVVSVNFNGQAAFDIDLNLGTNFSSGALQIDGWIVAFGSAASNQVMVTNKGDWQAALPLGARIGPEGKFQSRYIRMNSCFVYTSIGGSSGPWRNVTNRYLGLKFQMDGETHYGWARMDVTYGCYYTLTLTGYAYETVANRPIVAGVVPYANPAENMPAPQSGTLGVLAAGSSSRVPSRSEPPQ
jgi:hypothetical protein